MLYDMQDYVLRTFKEKIEAGILPEKVFKPRFGRKRVFDAFEANDEDFISKCHLAARECGADFRSFYMLKMIFEDSQLFEEPLQKHDDFA